MKAWASSDYYSVLGVKSGDTQETIKKAYKVLARMHHPDAGGDSQTFHLVAEAYKVLSDPVSRDEYDAFQIISGKRGETLIDASIAELFKEAFKEGYTEGVEQWRKGKHNKGKGHDVHATVTLTYKESVTPGLKKSVTIVHSTGCVSCIDGCEKCHEGWVVEERTVTFTVPEGITDGGKLKVDREGGFGETVRGDLYITFKVEKNVVASAEKLSTQKVDSEGNVDVGNVNVEGDTHSEDFRHSNDTASEGESVENVAHKKVPKDSLDSPHLQTEQGNGNEAVERLTTQNAPVNVTPPPSVLNFTDVKVEKRAVPQPKRKTSPAGVPQTRNAQRTSALAERDSELVPTGLKETPDNHSNFQPPPPPNLSQQKVKESSDTHNSSNPAFKKFAPTTTPPPPRRTQKGNFGGGSASKPNVRVLSGSNTILLTLPNFDNNGAGGGKVSITTPHGDNISFTLPSGVTVGSVLKVPNKGAFNPDTRQREDLLVKIVANTHQ